MDDVKAFLSKYINWTFLISVLFIVNMCGILSLKADYFVDEIYTYGKINIIRFGDLTPMSNWRVCVARNFDIC